MGVSTMRIAGTGCCLLDVLYPNIDFSSPAFASCRSRRDGDGGLSPGRLVFDTDLERFTGRPREDALLGIIGGAGPGAENVGGPSIVALIHAAQMLEGRDARVSYYGPRAGDEAGMRLASILARTPVSLEAYSPVDGPCPATIVLSDPHWDSGRGERSFVNILGAAARYGSDALGGDFFDSDIVAFGGTALTPLLHEALPDLLTRARSRGALTVINTVFDFQAERRDPMGAWPLGGASPGAQPEASAGPGPRESYEGCDLLVMDLEECRRLSGNRDLKTSMDLLRGSG
ncbi:MAG TPA: carbohydrate kinase family protein, partial [Rectinemataceae bacterium]|nr:carbohydrate kinase family protein [Rectinemataceae bacterium]